MVLLWCSLIQCSKVHETIEILGSFNIDTWLWFWICFLPAQYAVSSTFFTVSYSKLVFLLFLQVAPYERPALSKAYLFPEGNLVNTTNNFFLHAGLFCCTPLTGFYWHQTWFLFHLYSRQLCSPWKLVSCRNCKTSRIPCLCWKWRGEITSWVVQRERWVLL
jgi:hypothetical protein